LPISGRKSVTKNTDCTTTELLLGTVYLYAYPVIEHGTEWNGNSWKDYLKMLNMFPPYIFQQGSESMPLLHHLFLFECVHFIQLKVNMPMYKHILLCWIFHTQPPRSEAHWLGWVRETGAQCHHSSTANYRKHLHACF